MSTISTFEKCKELIKKINEIYQNLAVSLENKDVMNISAYTEDLMDTSEKLALTSRHLPDHYDFPRVARKNNSLKSVDSFDVQVEKEKWLKVTMPMLRHRKDTGRLILHEILLEALVKFFIKYEQKTKEKFRIDCGVMAFRFVYAHDYPKRLYYDYDNINEVELKKITDAISLFSFPDDGPFLFDRYYTASLGNETHVEVYAMKKSLFPCWLQRFCEPG